VSKLATVTGEQFANIGSYDMTGTMWQRLGRRVNELLSSPDVDAVVGTHGTDTLEEVDLVEAALRGGAKGIAIAGVGDGGMSTQVMDSLTRAARSGVAVVRSTRVSSGIVLRNPGAINDDERGFVVAGELNPAKARVLLQLELTRTNDPARIQKMFYAC
jgi:L-asparaginase